MGRDKAEIAYGPLPQWRVVADLLNATCAQTWWSCTGRQRQAWGVGERGILDHAPGLGPAGGLHAAFTLRAGVAWLVLACDYPHLTEHDVRRLVDARERGIDAVTFAHSSSGEIEPTLSLWEPAAQRSFLQAFDSGERSPRRVLRGVALRTVVPADEATLLDRDVPSSG